MIDENGAASAACACAPGRTARSVPAADGYAAEVSCIDERLSFLNPGDVNAAGEKLPDPCVGVSCGEHGTCVSMNMTATCECEPYYVASPTRDQSGITGLTCVLPEQGIPTAFYKTPLMPRDLPMGREVRIVEVPVSDNSGLCSVNRSGPTGGKSLGGLALGVLALATVIRRRRRV